MLVVVAVAEHTEAAVVTAVDPAVDVEDAYSMPDTLSADHLAWVAWAFVHEASCLHYLRAADGAFPPRRWPVHGTVLSAALSMTRAASDTRVS